MNEEQTKAFKRQYEKLSTEGDFPSRYDGVRITRTLSFPWKDEKNNEDSLNAYLQQTHKRAIKEIIKDIEHIQGSSVSREKANDIQDAVLILKRNYQETKVDQNVIYVYEAYAEIAVDNPNQHVRIVTCCSKDVSSHQDVLWEQVWRLKALSLPTVIG